MDKQRKKIYKQVAALAAVCVLILIVGRILAGNRFEMCVPLGVMDIPEEEKIRISWENDREIPVEEMSLRGRELLIVLRPQQPGDYAMTVMNSDTQEMMFYDDLHVTALGTTHSMQSRNFTGDNAVIAAVAVFLAGLAVISILHFVRRSGPQLYSYDSIWAFGVGMFCAVSGLNFTYILVQRLLRINMQFMRFVYESFSMSGFMFSFLMMPVMLGFAVLMIVSNLALLRHESFRVQNILGLGIGLALIGGEAFGIWLMLHDYSGSQLQIMILYTLQCVYFTAYTYFECILIGSVVSGLRAARHVPAPVQDYILILGCRFRKDGTLPPLLRGRVDKAIEFWKKQKEQGGKEAVLIPSGGQGGNEPMPEAVAMGRYLRECGIPDQAIMQEEKSRNTYQNMEFSKKLIEERDGSADDKNVIFVTTNYHVFRSGVWAGLAGLRAEGLGSETKWWFWPNAFIRECIGLLANRIVPEVIWLVILVAIFGGIATLIV